jgi:hypothetical protein
VEYPDEKRHHLLCTLTEPEKRLIGNSSIDQEKLLQYSFAVDHKFQPIYSIKQSITTLNGMKLNGNTFLEYSLNFLHRITMDIVSENP